MDSNYEVDVVISSLMGQTMALYNAVMVLIDLHPNPDEFASMYRDRLENLYKVLGDDIPKLLRAHGRAAQPKDFEAMRTAIREMSEGLLDHAAKRSNERDA